MRAHAERLGMPSPPKKIIATGGASANDHILRMIASIFGCNVYTVQKPGRRTHSYCSADSSLEHTLSLCYTVDKSLSLLKNIGIKNKSDFLL